MENLLLRKILDMSKYTFYGIIFQLVAFNMLMASESSVAQRKSLHEILVTINLEESSLQEVFSTLEEATGFTFAYKHSDLDNHLRVNIYENNKPLSGILENLAQITNLKFKRINENIHVSKIKGKENHVVEEIFQSITVSGKVTSTVDGAELPGVNVIESGTNNGTVTDINGNYSLTVSEGATLVFSSVGFNAQSIAVGGRSVVNVTLVEDIHQLQELVVIGYGTQKRADITGAVAVLNTENLIERPVQRLDQALVGQMAGVRVQQTSGIPGQGYRIQVRGTGSITSNNEPLYVVDGFPLEISQQNAGGDFATGNPLDNINPNDIESIQVLKDAASAAIYGSRASNGVVIITTKRGKTGKPTISFNAYGGISNESKRVDFLNAQEWIELSTEVINSNYLNTYSPFGATVNDDNVTRLNIINTQRAANNQAPLAAGTIVTSSMPDPRWDPNHPNHDEIVFIDWQDELFRTGITQNYNMAANGGNEFVNYYVSGDFLEQEGVMIGVDYKRYSARANVEVKASDRVRFGINIAPSYSIANNPGAEGKDQQMHLTGTVVPVSEASVGTEVNVGDNTFYTWGNSRVSPPAVLRESLGETRTFRTIGTAFLEINLLQGLNFRTTFNMDNADGNTKNYFPAIVDRNRATTGRLRDYRRQTYVNENTLNFDRTIGNNHHLSLLAGVSYNSTNFNNLDMRGNFPDEGITTLNAATINPQNTWSEETRNILISYFSRVQYNFGDRYLLSASLRRDGSSRFGNDTKWGIFPSASVGWRLSEESFMNNIDFLSDLKLRASWGIAGNNGFPGRFQGNYEHIALLEMTNYSFGNSLNVGQVPANIPNEKLSWEESETLDFGLDFGLFRNRIHTSFDYYIKTNYDLLLNIPIPSATGFTNALTNIGRVRNTGWELELITRNLTGDFEWNTNFNFSHNRNRVLALGPNNSDILGGAEDINHNILRVGEPMFSLYLVQQDGILSQADIEAGAALYGNQTAGDPKYVDQNDDNVINGDDRVISGKPNPDYIWGITNSFRYRGFDLNVLVQGQWGGSIYSLYGRAVDRTSMGYNENRLGVWRNRWRSEQDPGDGQRGKATQNFGRIKNTDWLYPSDYLRIRNITLGYNLGDLLEIPGISNLRIYATAENYFGWDKYDGGWNPEAVNYVGDDYGAAPLPKTLIFGLNVTF